MLHRSFPELKSVEEAGERLTCMLPKAQGRRRTVKRGALRAGHVCLPVSPCQSAHGVSPALHSSQSVFGWGWRVKTHPRVSRTVTDWQGRFCEIHVLRSEFIRKLKLNLSHFQTPHLKKEVCFYLLPDLLQLPRMSKGRCFSVAYIAYKYGGEPCGWWQAGCCHYSCTM